MHHPAPQSSREHRLQATLDRLQQLLSKYRDLLREDGLTQGVERLIAWMQQWEDGQHSVEPHINKEGQALLIALHDALEQSAREYMRIESESPAIAPAKVEAKAPRFAEASREVSDIIQQLLTDHTEPTTL